MTGRARRYNPDADTLKSKQRAGEREWSKRFANLCAEIAQCSIVDVSQDTVQDVRGIISSLQNEMEGKEGENLAEQIVRLLEGVWEREKGEFGRFLQMEAEEQTEDDDCIKARGEEQGERFMKRAKEIVQEGDLNNFYTIFSLFPNQIGRWYVAWEDAEKILGRKEGFPAETKLVAQAALEATLLSVSARDRGMEQKEGGREIHALEEIFLKMVKCFKYNPDKLKG